MLRREQVAKVCEERSALSHDCASVVGNNKPRSLPTLLYPLSFQHVIMPISIATLRQSSKSSTAGRVRKLTEARSLGLRSVFLCHSHNDAELVEGLLALFARSGWQVYVDWEDTSLPEKPNRETAIRIQQKIVELDLFLFLATPNSTTSRWCPWEIGYANGRKPIDSIIVCPTSDGSMTHGNEYLDLYRRLDLSDQGRLAVWQPGDSTNGIFLSSL